MNLAALLIYSSSSSAKKFSLCGKTFDTSACQLSQDILANMFAKADRLLCAPEGTSICLSPGSSTSRLVESKSGQRPHFVQKKTANKYCCDSDCPMWRCSKLCSHTVACAFQDDNLQQFISHTTGQPSFYALAKSGTTEKAGGKPTRKRKASTKATTQALSRLQEEIAPMQQPITGISAQPPPKSVATSTTTQSHAGNTGITANPRVNISQAQFASSSIVVPNSITQSPVISLSQPSSSASLSVNPVRSPIASISSPTVCQIPPTPLSATGGPASNTALSSLLSQVLAGAPSSSIVIDPNHLFGVMFVSGNISRCQGCLGKISRAANGKPLPPPDDIVLQHKEQVLFQNPKTGIFQLSYDLRNVYYHARFSYKFKSFQAGAHVRVSMDTHSKIVESHKSYLGKEFGIKFVNAM